MMELPIKSHSASQLHLQADVTVELVWSLFVLTCSNSTAAPIAANPKDLNIVMD